MNTPEIFLTQFLRISFSAVSDRWLASLFRNVRVKETSDIVASARKITSIKADELVNPYYNKERAESQPRVFLDFPNLSKGSTDGVGLDFDGQDFTRSFGFTHALLLTAKNHLDLVLLSAILRGFFVANNDYLEQNAYRNINTMEQSIQFPPEILPETIYSRVFTVRGEYDFKIGRLGEEEGLGFISQVCVVPPQEN